MGKLCISSEDLIPAKKINALYEKHHTKLTGNWTSESMNNISSILESNKPQLPKLSNTIKY